MGRVAVIFILASAILGGAGLYYTQVYAYYDAPVEAAKATLTLQAAGSNEPRELNVKNYEWIDKDSSPLGYRACFDVGPSIATLTETYALIEDAVPLEAPVWFECFDADALGAALSEGRALAFMGEPEIADGVDRVIAVTDDGQGFSWHQLNDKYKD